MIPSTTNQYLTTEDWKKIYQSYPNAEFQSYDFETLRRVMISYLQENYPEDFNDYIDSSEYLALVDLIAFMGQNLSFRVDLNARENFLETAQRRDSILRLAKLIGYNPSRNVPANGFLKIVSVSTSDIVLDSNGVNLANRSIGWNDPTNANWYDQFVSILNSTMPSGFIFGRPYDEATINGIDTQQYRINSSNTDVSVFSFNSNVNGNTMAFEIVSSLFAGQNYVYEEPPKPGTQFSFLYKNDNQGNSSANTGFFVHFKQGTLSSTNFSVTNPTPDELISINASGTNQSDIWLWQLNLNGNYQTLWTQVPNLVGNNVIYNSIANQIKTVYSVLTRDQDQFDLSFADGSFGQLPQGNFNLFYRQSNGLTYTIRPDQLSNITVNIPYTNKNGQSNSLKIVLSLQETVSNSQATESNASIQLKAPQSYYVQNRMITAEDYNIAPLTAGTDIVKIHSVNRTASGISRYFELSDVSGEYSSTNIFATDGIIYKKRTEQNFNFTFVNQNEITGVIDNQLGPIISSPEVFNFYLDLYPRVSAINLFAVWTQNTKSTNQSTGYFSILGNPVSVGSYSGTELQYCSPNALIKFVAPTGSYFTPNDLLTTTPDETTKNYIWAKVISITGDGSNGGQGALSNGNGPILISKQIPSGSIIEEIIPAFESILPIAIQSEMVDIITATRNMGLGFDSTTREWYIIEDSNLDLINDFGLSFQKDTSNIGKDNGWIISLQWNGINYQVRYRTLEYVFESERQTAFFVDNTVKNYDFVADTVIKDQISVLAINQSITPTTVTINTSTPLTLISTTTVQSSLVGSSAIYLNRTWVNSSQLGSVKYYAVHPAILGGSSLVTGFSTSGTVYLQSAISNVAGLPSGDTITFIPTTVNLVSTASITPAEVNQYISLSTDYQWEINSAVVEPDGFVDPKKVLISFFDHDENGQIDDPDAFNNIVVPYDVSAQTGYLHNFVYFKYLADGTSYQLADPSLFTAYPTQNDVAMPSTSTIYYFYDPSVNVIQTWSDVEQAFILNTQYFAYTGRSGLKFHYLHNSGRDRRIDPSKTNLIDIYLLTTSYDTEYRAWLAAGTGVEPLPPTSSELADQYQSVLDPIKSISDELVFQPAVYKVLFGSQAAPALQATFKAVQNPNIFNSTNSLKTRILTAIENFFALENWNFGDTFNFSELVTYVMNVMTPDITNFVIVPVSSGAFGSLFEITSQSNEIFINGATVDNIEIIDAITASQLQASGSVVTSTTRG